MCHAYSATQYSVTGFSPYYLMFGRHPRLPIDYQLGITRDNLAQPSKFRFVNKLNERLHEPYAKAEALIQEEANRQKKLYDRRSKDVVLSPGDLAFWHLLSPAISGIHLCLPPSEMPMIGELCVMFQGA